MAREVKYKRILQRLKEGQLNPEYVDVYGFRGTIDPNNLLHEQRLDLLVSNCMNKMRDPGAKGSATNCCQMSGLVGQQNLAGERPSPSIRDKRTSCSQMFDDNSPATRGMIESCYYDGLRPVEMFFHCQAGREGVIATSLKTGETGYCGKKLSKKLDGFVVREDGSVRNASGHILQFLYGGDGMSCGAVCSFSYCKTPLFCDITALAKKYCEETLPNGKTKRARRIPPEAIEGFLRRLYVGQPGTQTKIHKRASRNFRTILRPLLAKVQLPSSAIKAFFVDLEDRFQKAKVPYGEVVGLLASLSIAEPTMQMMLNTFHSTGLGEKDVSVGGVPRAKELYGTNQNPASPACSFNISVPELEQQLKHLEEQTPKPMEEIKQLRIKYLTECEKFGRDLEGLYLKDLCKNPKILAYIPEGSENPQCLSEFPFDHLPPQTWKPEWWSSFFQPPEERCWVLSLEMNLEMLHKYRIQLDHIKDVIKNEYEDDDEVNILKIFTSPNKQATIQIFFSCDWLMMISFGSIPASTMRNHDYFVCQQIMLPILQKTRISGLDTIGKCYVRKTHDGYAIDATGKCFQDMLKHPSEPMNVVSNNMWDIYNTFGVEATRCYLMEEFTRIISFDNNYINPHHIEILVDSMLLYGQISSVKSGGIGREVGPLAKCLFEKNITEMAYASAMCESDPLTSVAASVMFGMPSRVGTGAVKMGIKTDTGIRIIA
jgi:hypothetical protein